MGYSGLLPGEGSKELGTAPGTPPTPSYTHRGGTPCGHSPVPTGPREENPMPSQDLLSKRSCIPRWRPIFLVSSSPGLCPLSASLACPQHLFLDYPSPASSQERGHCA